MGRFAKQLIIAGVFLCIVALVGWRAYRAFVPAPTCSDRVQNQGEEGVDCGLVCGTQCAVARLPLQTVAVDILPSGSEAYDIALQIVNPNDVWGVARAPYTLTLADASGATITERTGIAYAAPKQVRHIVESFLGISRVPVSATVQWASASMRWESVDAVRAAAAVDFAIRNESFAVVQEPGVAARYQALVRNGSNFDFDRVDITVLAYDDAGVLLGAGSTALRTVIAKTERGITVSWPAPFARPVASTRAFVTTNVFENGNFLRTYGVPQPVF